MNKKQVSRVLAGFVITTVLLLVDVQSPYFPFIEKNTFGVETSLPSDLEDAISQLEKTETRYEPLGNPGIPPPRVPIHLKELVVELSAINEAEGDITDTDDDGLYNSVEAVLGTAWDNADSDSDHLSDFDEIINYE